MKKSLYVLVAVLSVFGLVVWLSACGGGGSGGSSGGGGGTTPTTTGPTYQLDEEGVQAALEYVADLGIGCEFEGGGEVSTALRNVSEVGADMADQIVGRFLAARSATSMDRALLGEDPVNETINMTGPCGGALTGQIVDTGSTLDIELDFDNVCIEVGDMDGDGFDDQVTIDGSLDFGGSYVESSGGDLSSISISGGTGAGGIDIDLAGESASVVLTGFSFSATGLDTECGASLSLDIDYFSLTLPVDGSTETITVEDLAIDAAATSIGGGCGVTLTAEATITAPDGTLDISTPTALTVDDEGDVITGQVLLEGADDTSVLITYAGTPTEPYVFTVAADTDGDGTAEEVGSMDCSDVEGVIPDL